MSGVLEPGITLVSPSIVGWPPPYTGKPGTCRQLGSGSGTPTEWSSFMAHELMSIARLVYKDMVWKQSVGLDWKAKGNILETVIVCIFSSPMLDCVAQLSMNPRPNIMSYHVCMEDRGLIGQKLGCG